MYVNNSVISITEIGETSPDTDLNEGLQCITDRVLCCRTAFRAGEWYFPNGTMVPVESPTASPSTFYRNRGRDDRSDSLRGMKERVDLVSDSTVSSFLHW